MEFFYNLTHFRCIDIYIKRLELHGVIYIQSYSLNNQGEPQKNTKRSSKFQEYNYCALFPYFPIFQLKFFSFFG